MFHSRPWRLLYGIESLSNRVAQRCRATVLQRVLPDAAEMSPAEASGYIRARASSAVVFHSAVLLTELGAPKDLGPELVAMAKRRVVTLVLGDLRSSQRQPVLYRRAA